MIADPTLLPLPCQTLAEQTDVNFLSTCISKSIELVPNFSIGLSVCQTLSLVQDEPDLFGYFMSAENTHDLLSSFQQREGNC